MKTIFAALMLFCVSVQAESDAWNTDCKARKECYCTYLGTAFQTAARDRDEGMTPQEAFSDVMGYAGVIEVDRLKKAVNLIYFDDAFRYARGRGLQMQIIQACANGVRKFEPVK
jgi:hypothetical protein